MYLYPRSISLPSASYAVIICQPAPLRLLPPAHPIPSPFVRALITSMRPPPSAHLPFWEFRDLCICAEAASARLAPFAPLPLRLRRDALAVEQAQVAFHLARTSRATRAPVDGGGWRSGWNDDADADWMKTEKHATGDGNADEDRVRVRIYRSLTLRLRLRFGNLSFCPPAFAFVLALAFVPTFAHTLAPTLLLVPAPPSPCPCCVVRATLASSCSGTRTYSRTRRDGMHVRAPPLPHRRSRNPPPAQPAQCIRATQGTLISRRACVRVPAYVCAYHSRAPARHRAIGAGPYTRPGVAVFLRRYEGVRSAVPGILLGLDEHSYAVEVGMGKARGYVVGARTLCPPLPCTRSYFSSVSLAIFLSKLGRIPMFCTI
jgi:hypothetical protein